MIPFNIANVRDYCCGNLLGPGIPPEPPIDDDNFFYGFTEADTTGDPLTEEEFIGFVNDVFTATQEQTGTFTPGGNITVVDFGNEDDKVMFIQVPAAEAPFTLWSEVGNPLQQNQAIDPDFATDLNVWFKSTRDGQTIYLTRYQTSFTGAIVLSR
ncbi:MAG: hypothetical protein IPQ08_06340 [Chitinophagaceae bacterium]|nr:hypothetical protein [Chitinophagaceae bacterium]